MISDLRHMCPHSPMWDYGKDVEPKPLRGLLKKYWSMPYTYRKEWSRPTKENDTDFDEMISLRLKKLDYDQKKKVFEFIETLRAARREAREG